MKSLTGIASAARNRNELPPPRQRSAVTNGRRLFVDGDGNSAWSRRYRDLVIDHSNDMGGAAVLSEAQKSLIKRASAIELELEQMEDKLSMGREIDLDKYTRAAGHLRRKALRGRTRPRANPGRYFHT